MRSFRHWTFHFLLSRARDIRYRKKHPDQPWLTPQAIAIVESWLKPTDVGMEWGSGRSTVWLASRIKKLLSIEHDPSWYEKISGELNKSGIADKVDYRLLPLPTSSPPVSEGNDSYAGVVNEFPDGSFDFVLVDGRIRHVCMRMVLPKISPGGLLVLDDSERYVPCDGQGTYFEKQKEATKILYRQEWQEVLSKIESWRTIRTTNGVSRTRLWIKAL